MLLLQDVYPVDPRWGWMREQDRLNTPEGEKYWLWDTGKAAGVVYQDMIQDGHFYNGCGEDAGWYALKAKFMDEPFLSLIKRHFETGEREYNWKYKNEGPGSRTVFEVMSGCLISYTVAIVKMWEDKTGSDFHDGKLWRPYINDQYRLIYPNKQQLALRDMKPAPDGKSLIPMTPEEIKARDDEINKQNEWTEQDEIELQERLNYILSDEFDKWIEEQKKKKDAAQTIRKNAT